MCYFLLTQLIFGDGMQGQPLSTHFEINNDVGTTLKWDVNVFN